MPSRSAGDDASRRDAEAAAWPSMELPIAPPLTPTEARPTDELPAGDPWQYEPKWDGRRCLAFRDGDVVVLQSKSGLALTDDFPEIVRALRAVPARRFVLDGEIVVSEGAEFSRDALSRRMHARGADGEAPEASVERLAARSPATLLVFDLLVDERGRSLVVDDLATRRAALEAFARENLLAPGVRLSPATTDRRVVARWKAALSGRGIDGIVAKRRDRPYASGERSAMRKVTWPRSGARGAAGERSAR